MATRPARLTGGAVAVASVLALGGVVGARAVGDAAVSARETGARRAAAGTARAFEAAIDGVRHSVANVALLAPQIAQSPTSPPPSLDKLMSPDGIKAVVVIPLRGAASVVTGMLPPAVGIETLRDDLASALELARDTNDPHADVVQGAIGIAVPVFRTAVVSTQDRRSALSAWVVSVVDPAALLARVTAPGESAGLTVGGISVAGATRAKSYSVDSSTTLAGQPLNLLVTAPVEGGAPAIALAILLLGLAGAAGALLVWRRSDRMLLRAYASNDALERETRTVAEIGPLLQQSLDLAEVLPAVAVRLSDEFLLDAFSVELTGEHGDPVDVFSVGRRSTGEAEVIVGPEGMPSGIEFALPLLRAGRTIGRLRVVAREHLAPTQVDALRGAADLIAVATYNVELYEREQATVRRLQDLDRLKDAFLGTISHELRTPITAIGGFTRMLNERWDELTEDQRRDFLRRVGRNSTSLGLLVDDLLDFARLERQALQTDVSPLELDHVVATFVAQVVPALGDHPVDTDLAEGVVALADPRAIERVLANLLTNAAKFSPPGTPVEVGLRTGDHSAIITVSDHGPGIAADDRIRIFTRFYRGESDAARSTRGAGIGLAVVHELVTQMGGDITVRGREPNGTTMIVRLPLATPAQPVELEPPAHREPMDDLISTRSKP